MNHPSSSGCWSRSVVNCTEKSTIYSWPFSKWLKASCHFGMWVGWTYYWCIKHKSLDFSHLRLHVSVDYDCGEMFWTKWVYPRDATSLLNVLDGWWRTLQELVPVGKLLLEDGQDFVSVTCVRRNLLKAKQLTWPLRGYEVTRLEPFIHSWSTNHDALIEQWSCVHPTFSGTTKP